METIMVWLQLVHICDQLLPPSLMCSPQGALLDQYLSSLQDIGVVVSELLTSDTTRPISLMGKNPSDSAT